MAGLQFMKISLVIDTSTPRTIAAIVADQKEIWSGFHDGATSHGEALGKLIDEAKNQATFKSINQVVVGMGPGPFTGLRVGIAFAKTFIGTPYHWGGTTPSGFDCSGFINYIFGNFGFSLSRTSYNLAELGETVKLENLQAGDLMFFKGSNPKSTTVGHVAMVIEVTPDAIRFIHSANSGVKIDNFKTSKYYISRYLKAKRLDYTTYRKD